MLSTAELLGLSPPDLSGPRHFQRGDTIYIAQPAFTLGTFAIFTYIREVLEYKCLDVNIIFPHSLDMVEEILVRRRVPIDVDVCVAAHAAGLRLLNDPK
jgi:hypothetical protein